MTPQEIRNQLIRDAERQVDEAEESAARYQALILRVENGVLGILASLRQFGDRESLVLRTQASRLIREARSEAIGLFAEDAVRVAALAVDSQIRSIQAQSQSAAAADVVRALQVFRQRIEDRSIIRIAEPYLSDWLASWDERWLRFLRVLQRSSVVAIRDSEDTSYIAERIRRPLGSLNVGGNRSAEQFARAFARTSQSQLYADLAVIAAQEAGLDRFISIGIPDDRQSLECWEAMYESAKTWPEWKRWKASNGGGGAPGERHVHNCRCTPGAVLAERASEDWGQETP